MKMKRIMVVMAIVITCTQCVFAQGTQPETTQSATDADIEAMVNGKNPYTLYKKNMIAEYCFQYKGKQISYMGGPTYVQQIVSDVKVKNGQLVSFVQHAFFNKKHSPSKGISAKFKEFTFPTAIDTAGNYRWAHNILQDFLMIDDRKGYGVLIPNDMKLGMQLQCSTIYDKTKNGFGAIINLETTYSDWQVVSEEKVTTPAGTFDCMKLTGRLQQKNNGINPNTNEEITCWMARGIGIVRYETISSSDKKREPVILYLNSLEQR